MGRPKLQSGCGTVNRPHNPYSLYVSTRNPPVTVLDERGDRVHIICHCPTPACKRYRTLGPIFLKPKDLENVRVNIPVIQRLTQTWCSTLVLFHIQVKCSRYRPACGPEGGYRYSRTLPRPRHQKGVSGQQHAPAVLYPRKKAVPILQEIGLAPGPVWKGGKSRPTGIRSPDLPGRSQSLYRLSYRSTLFHIRVQRNNYNLYIVRFHNETTRFQTITTTTTTTTTTTAGLRIII